VRLVVITSVAIPYLLKQLADPTGQPTFDLLFLIAGSTFVVSLVYIGLLSVLRAHLVWQASIQFAGDLLLVTALVYWFGGIGSPFSMLYLIVIAVASTMLRRRAGLWVATGAYVLYAALLFALFVGQLPEIHPAVVGEERIWRLTYNLAVHLFGFYAVALLTSFLSQNVARAEQALEEKVGSLANLEIVHQDVIQSISSGLITTDLAGMMTSVNRAAAEILGMAERDLVGRPLAASGLFTDGDWGSLAVTRSDRQRTRAETVLERGDAVVPIGYSLTTLADAQGKPTGYILVFQDLSDWHRLQEELRLKDRMAAVGELAAGIAHEIGNPLAAISGSVQLLSASPDNEPAQRKLLDIIVKESQRLDRTIKGFLRFARPRDRSAVPFDIARLLTENLELLRNSQETQGQHRLRLELDPPSVALIADPDQISQIFWNLARNALRAMPGGGTLEVSGRLEGETYRIRFRDSGKGMTEEQRAKLFQPFQSFFDGGTGIGMAIVYRIVQEHGGSVVVDSAPGQGTTITVELPAAGAVTTAAAAQVTA
jgi:two-component system sensor histidine kinase PilS (NtrC family)